MSKNTQQGRHGYRRVSVLAVAGLLAFGVAAGNARAADDIVIGASLPLSSPLAGFGSYEQWGYKRAVDEVKSCRWHHSRRQEKTSQAHHPR